MKITVKTGLIFALVWILAKMIFYWLDAANPEIPMLFINSFCLILSISVGLYLVKRAQPESNALGDIKNGLTAGLPYTLVVSLFLYMFYTYINEDYTKHKINERITAVEKYIADDDNWNKIKENASYETYTREMYVDSEKESAEIFNSAKFVAIISMLGGLMLGTFYSIFVTIIFRKVVFR